MCKDEESKISPTPRGAAMPADLQHRDWLLFSTQRMIQKVDETITVSIRDTPNGGKILIASGISESSIEKLSFLVNTDKNNNYLYLEDLRVHVNGRHTPVNIDGLQTVAITMFRSSDLDNYVLGNLTHMPFSVNNLTNTSFKGNTFAEFIDEYSALQPFTTSTYGYVKMFEIVLNPDLNLSRTAQNISSSSWQDTGPLTREERMQGGGA